MWQLEKIVVTILNFEYHSVTVNVATDRAAGSVLLAEQTYKDLGEF